MARSDTFHADGVRRLYEVTRRVSGSADLAEVLEEIAQGVVEGLGYGVAAISRLEGDTLVMAAVGGPEDAARADRRAAYAGRERSSDASSRWPTTGASCASCPTSGCRRRQIESLWVPDLEVSDDPDAWHPLDALYAPLYSSNGELLGNMAVDLPPGNKIPTSRARAARDVRGAGRPGARERPAARAAEPAGAARRGAQDSWRCSSGHRRPRRAALRGGGRRRCRRRSPSPQVTVRCFADNVDDPDEPRRRHAAPGPAPPRSWSPALRDDLVWQRRPARACCGPTVVLPAPDDEFDEAVDVGAPDPAAARALGGRTACSRRSGSTARCSATSSCCAATTSRAFEADEVDAVHEAGRELGRLVRDVRLRRTERRLVSRAARARPLQGRADRDHLPRAEDPAHLDHRPHRAARGGRRAADVGRARSPATRRGSTGWSPTSSTTPGSRAAASSSGSRSTSASLCRAVARDAADPGRQPPASSSSCTCPTPRCWSWATRRSCPGRRQPLQQRREVHPARWPGRASSSDADGEDARVVGERHRPRHLAARTRSTCSRRSTAPPTPRRSPSPAPGWGSRSPAPSPRLHGGTIVVESDLGRGSTFTLSVPLAGGLDRLPRPRQRRHASVWSV